MKTIGMIGGMSCESTVVYYQLINQEVKRRLGGHHNAKSVLVTVDFDEIERMQRTGEWATMGGVLSIAGRQAERAGADFVILCTNTMHRVAGHIEAAIQIPFLHIADATAAALNKAGHKRAALLGTRFTMEQPFLRARLEQSGIEVLTPGEPERVAIHQVIFDELVHGVILPESRDRFSAIITNVASRGAEAVILGCTEIGLLVGPEDSILPIHDTAKIHALAAVDEALA
jgi:aspartate racemase